MSPTDLRRACWAALPAALPAGAVVTPPVNGTEGSVAVDGIAISVDIEARAGVLYLRVGRNRWGDRPSATRSTPENAPARIAVDVIDRVRTRQAEEAEARDKAARAAQAQAWTAAAGSHPSRYERNSVIHNVAITVDDDGYRLTVQRVLSAEQMDRVLTTLREIGACS